MNVFKKLSLFLLVCAFATALPAQTLLTTTTLASATGNTVSSALTSGNLGAIAVASATGILAPTANSGNVATISTSGGATYLFVDRELMQVEAVSGTTITVIRGVGSTSASSHVSGALVFVVPAAAAAVWSGGGYGQGLAVPQGSCARSAELYLPRIQFNSGLISDCLNGQWYNGDALQTSRTHSKVMYAPNPGGTIYTSLNSTGTTLVAGTLYCTEIQLPYSKLLTGLAVLNGTVVGTDNHLVALYDAGMNLLASSAAAGALAATASNYQSISFTAPYYAVGPAQYFGCVQSNGTTATVRMLVTQVQDQYLTTSKTATFGTVPATITAPTTFTTAVGPYFGLF